MEIVVEKLMEFARKEGRGMVNKDGRNFSRCCRLYPTDYSGRDKLKFRRDKSERKSREGEDEIEVKRKLGYTMNRKNI